MLSCVLDLLFPRAVESVPSAAMPCTSVGGPIVEEADNLRRRGIRHLDRIIAAGSYHEDDTLRRAVHALKYRGGSGESRFLAERFVSVCGSVIDATSAQMSPVPLHWTRRWMRGCNQSQLLARELQSLAGAHITLSLRRRRRTGHQTRLNRIERMEAMRRNPFIVRCARPPKTVVLVDDVVTTGATLDACAQAWKQAGAERVEAWVMAYDKAKR